MGGGTPGGVRVWVWVRGAGAQSPWGATRLVGVWGFGCGHMYGYGDVGMGVGLLGIATRGMGQRRQITVWF